MMRADSLSSLPDDPEDMEEETMSFDELPIIVSTGDSSSSSGGSGTSATTGLSSSGSGSSSPTTTASPPQSPLQRIIDTTSNIANISSSNGSNKTILTSATAKQSKFLRQRKESIPTTTTESTSATTTIDENNNTNFDSIEMQTQIMNQFLSLSGQSPSSGGLYHGISADDTIDLPVRKESDFDVEKFLLEQQQLQKSNRTNRMYSKAVKSTRRTGKKVLGGGAITDNDRSSSVMIPFESSLGSVRSWDQIVTHFMLELRMLRRDACFITFVLIYQWVHSVFTNLAYYYHTQLTAAQRVPLMDAGFQALPLLKGSMWMISEYMVYSMVAIVVLSILLILVVRMYPPHGRPLYCIPIVRRMGMTLIVCQTLRIVSFMVTTLPGPARQCMYHVPEDMTRDEMLMGPAHSRGQPDGWAPPQDWNDILWRVDATNGCGDLMFSSHTIFTMLFVCITFTYFNWRPLKFLMAIFQLSIVPFILAAHKHYSVDVFTALYVTPLVFEMLRLKFPDLDMRSATMSSHYNIRFYLTRAGSYVVSVWGKEYYVDPQDLPSDLQQAHYGVTAGGKKPKQVVVAAAAAAPPSSSGSGIQIRVKPSKSDDNDTLSPSEVSAMIV
mmetsp:Transcript_7879/g.11368  ORF Transcript_7879/g.11368 Transcript_7879/m.11368 type:complete len:610 (+) Transcript_7879:490-2319(+)